MVFTSTSARSSSAARSESRSSSPPDTIISSCVLAGVAAKNRDGNEHEPERITAKLKTNLWLASDDSARGAIPDIMKKIRELQGLPEPSVMTQKALERMETPLDKLVADFRQKKGKRRDNKPALER